MQKQEASASTNLWGSMLGGFDKDTERKSMRKVIHLREASTEIKRKAKENRFLRMGRLMKELGKMISSTAISKLLQLLKKALASSSNFSKKTSP